MPLSAHGGQLVPILGAVTRRVHLANGSHWLGGPSRLAGLNVRLAVDSDGCVFGDAGEGQGVALLWPVDYSARRTADDAIEVIDRAGNVVVREGERFATGGGFTSDDYDTPLKRHALEVHGRELFVIGRAIERQPS